MKQLLAILLGVAAVTGIASAAELPADPSANANRPTIPAITTDSSALPPLNIRRIPRPSIRSVLDRRPALPGGKNTNNLGNLPSIPTGIWQIATGSISSWTQLSGGKRWTIYSTPTWSWQEDPVLWQQNAENVRAYREENGYIMRFLAKQTTMDAKKNQIAIVESAIKTLLNTRKSMIASYTAAASTETPMSEDQWNSKAEAAVAAYRATLLPYIDQSKLSGFERFIIGRTNMLKQLYEELDKK